jgi:16S rRNA A1518/A1519 N6-dimethyltransferase RsmA/KsgA/DIM1 with predicted DNA glycosylase/AP lyase activity
MHLKIPTGAFYPTPKVDSVTLAHRHIRKPADRRRKVGPFFRLNKAGFSQNRKMLLITLSSSLHNPRE